MSGAFRKLRLLWSNTQYLSFCYWIAAAKSLQSCPTLCSPVDSSPPGSPVHGILQARILKWVAISFSNAWQWKVKVKLLSCVWLLVTPWAVAHQTPPSMGLSRLEYWTGLPFPSPCYWIILVFCPVNIVPETAVFSILVNRCSFFFCFCFLFIAATSMGMSWMCHCGFDLHFPVD